MSTKKGLVLWFTGLSGAGKTTVADKVDEILKNLGVACQRLDGDLVRKVLTRDLGFTKEDRDINIERVAFVADLLSRHGVIVLATFISPYQKHREMVKGMVNNFAEVHVSAPLNVCEERDVKGLYKKARSGEIKLFTGIDDPYEEPANPDLLLPTHEEDVGASVKRVVEFLKEGGYIG